MITSVAPSAIGAALPFLPLSASLTSIGLPSKRSAVLTIVVPNVGDAEFVSTGRYGRTSARYVRIVLDPWELPEQPPALQDVGAFGFPKDFPLSAVTA